jgi:hypothetical protein
MTTKSFLKYSAFATMLLLPSISFASTGSTELSPILTFLQDNMNGIVGKLIVFVAFILAALNIAIKFNPYVCAGCVGTALFALYADNFLISMFGAVI